MIRRVGPAMYALACDVSGCPERFYTGAIKRVVRTQAREAGRWLRPRIAESPRRKADACPAHVVDERGRLAIGGES